MAQASLFSPVWYRVAELRPRIRPHARLHRQHFRGGRWFVLHDQANNRFYRFTPAAQVLIGLMDGRRTMQRIWELAGERLGDDLPTQDETVQLLAQLHAADMLYGDAVPDVIEVAERGRTQKRRRLMMAVRNPLSVRLPLLDPDRFLDATFWIVRPLFGPLGALIWLLVVLSGGTLALMHWPELTSNAYDRVLAAENLLLLALAYPLIKAVHELGHGYAVKRWGGEVHELGVMFMVLMPIPYVDASGAHAFQDKRQRMLVGGAGILVELFVAAVAMILWVLLEEGLTRALAFNVMLIGGVSTLLFNGNPLLRFDGYYVLADWIEIPNLGQRANRYLGYLCQRYLFGIETAESPVTAGGERRWFLAYALGSFVYRMAIMVGIALLVAGKLFFIGVLLALWALVMMLLLPLGKGLWYLISSPELERRRGRAFAAAAAVVVALLGPALLVPLPTATVTQGVVWLPESSHVRAPESGIVKAVLARAGAQVRPGETLVRLDDPILEARLAVAAAALHEARVRLAAAEVRDPLRAEIVREETARAAAALARLREQQANMTVASQEDGLFVPAEGSDLTGRFLAKGDLLGYVLEPGVPLLRIAVRQQDIQRVAETTRSVSVRFADDPSRGYPARVLRVTPQATREIPSRALAIQGGGAIPLDPSDAGGVKTMESLFVIDMQVEDGPVASAFGTRVYARFDHGREPLAAQAYRAVRQLFLREFDL